MAIWPVAPRKGRRHRPARRAVGPCSRSYPSYRTYMPYLFSFLAPRTNRQMETSGARNMLLSSLA